MDILSILCSDIIVINISLKTPNDEKEAPKSITLKCNDWLISGFVHTHLIYYQLHVICINYFRSMLLMCISLGYVLKKYKEEKVV